MFPSAIRDDLQMEISTGTLIALLFAALLAGWVDAVVGGGGLIQLPALLIGLPDDVPVATVAGTNKVSSVAGTFVASLTYLRKVAVTVTAALPLMFFAFVGSSGGARLAHFIPKEFFTFIVLAVLVVVGTYTIRRPSLGLNHEIRYTGIRHAVTLSIVGLVIGIYDGILGPGTGTFFVIAIVAFLGYGFLEASALSKLANLTTNVAAIVVFGFSGSIIWKLGLLMACANFAGGLIGARTAVKYGSGFVRKVFLVVLVGLAIRLIWDIVRSVL